LQEVREREKHQKWKVSHMDPRNASRCPSAAREPTYRLRYQSPINACKLNSKSLFLEMGPSFSCMIIQM